MMVSPRRTLRSCLLGLLSFAAPCYAQDQAKPVESPKWAIKLCELKVAMLEEGFSSHVVLDMAPGREAEGPPGQTMMVVETYKKRVLMVYVELEIRNKGESSQKVILEEIKLTPEKGVAANPSQYMLPVDTTMSFRAATNLDPRKKYYISFPPGKAILVKFFFDLPEKTERGTLEFPTAPKQELDLKQKGEKAR